MNARVLLDGNEVPQIHGSSRNDAGGAILQAERLEASGKGVINWEKSRENIERWNGDSDWMKEFNDEYSLRSGARHHLNNQVESNSLTSRSSASIVIDFYTKFVFMGSRVLINGKPVKRVSGRDDAGLTILLAKRLQDRGYGVIDWVESEKRVQKWNGDPSWQAEFEAEYAAAKVNGAGVKCSTF